MADKESQQDAADALARSMKRLHDCTKKVGDHVYEAFTAHPRAKRMTYCEHFRGAAWTALRMVGGAAALAVHSVFPFLFQTTGSDTVSALHREHGERKELLDADVVQQLVEEPLEEPEGLEEHQDGCEACDAQEETDVQEKLDEPLEEPSELQKKTA